MAFNTGGFDNHAFIKLIVNLTKWKFLFTNAISYIKWEILLI